MGKCTETYEPDIRNPHIYVRFPTFPNLRESKWSDFVGKFSM